MLNLWLFHRWFEQTCRDMFRQKWSYCWLCVHFLKMFQKKQLLRFQLVWMFQLKIYHFLTNKLHSMPDLSLQSHLVHQRYKDYQLFQNLQWLLCQIFLVFYLYLKVQFEQLHLHPTMTYFYKWKQLYCHRLLSRCPKLRQWLYFRWQCRKSLPQCWLLLNFLLNWCKQFLKYLHLL